MGIRIGFVVFVVCATGICFTQRDMYLCHEFKVLKCFSSQLILSISFDANLFLHALFVWQIHTHWIPVSMRDVIRNLCGVVWYLNTFKGIHHLGGFNFFFIKKLGPKILLLISLRYFYTCHHPLITTPYFSPSQFPICLEAHTKSSGTNWWCFFLVKYVFWNSCFSFWDCVVHAFWMYSKVLRSQKLSV